MGAPRRALHDIHLALQAVRVQRAAYQRAAHQRAAHQRAGQALRDVIFYVIRIFISMDQYCDSGIRATPRERVASEQPALCPKTDRSPSSLAPPPVGVLFLVPPSPVGADSGGDIYAFYPHHYCTRPHLIHFQVLQWSPPQ